MPLSSHVLLDVSGTYGSPLFCVLEHQNPELRLFMKFNDDNRLFTGDLRLPKAENTEKIVMRS
jgi:hypothetical protein